MGRFGGKTVMITGGTRGIGLAGAQRIRAEGGQVIASGRGNERSILGDDCQIVLGDVCDCANVQALVAAAERAGGLDGLWLNAGFARVGALEALTAECFDALMATNVRAPALQLARLSPLLKPDASVVVTASSSAFEAAPLVSAYAATKGALLSMMRCWAASLAPRGVRVNAIVPGPIDTGFRGFMGEAAQAQFERGVVDLVPLGRAGSAQEAAAVALFLLSADAAYVTGSQYAVDGGLLMR